MTKETLILYWLSVYKPDQWSVRYMYDLILYTVRKENKIFHIEYRFNAEYDHECTVICGEKVEVFGTVEYCLKQMRLK